MRKKARAWPLLIVVATTLSSSLALVLLGGCSDDSSTESSTGIREAPPPADPQVGDPKSTTPSTPTNCEELGSIGAPKFARLTPSTLSQSINSNLDNRPVTSRFGIIGIGTRADLQGKSVALGTGLNANYESCTHCFAIALGCGPADCTSAAWFYPKSGTAVFSKVAEQDGEKFEGKFTDVVLERVSIDWISGQSTPIPGGACFHVQELDFSATASSINLSRDAGTSGTGTTDAGTDSSSGGSSTSSTSGGGGTSSGGCFAAFAGQNIVGCTGKDLNY